MLLLLSIHVRLVRWRSSSSFLVTIFLLHVLGIRMEVRLKLERVFIWRFVESSRGCCEVGSSIVMSLGKGGKTL